MDVDDVGHSTEGIPISLEALELAEKVQDNSLVLNYLLSFSMEMEWRGMDQAWVLLEDSLHKMQSDSNKGLSILGPFGFSYSLKKKKKKENHSFLHFAFSIPALKRKSGFLCHWVPAPRLAQVRLTFRLLRLGPYLYFSLLSTYLPLTLKGHYSQLEN